MPEFSFSYKFLRFLGLNFSVQEYSNISFKKLIDSALKHIRNAWLLKYCMFSSLLSPLNYRKIRPIVWRWMGAKVGKDCYIGYDVWVDMTNMQYIDIEDHVHISTRCSLLCHQRNLSNYHVEDDYAQLPYQRKKILLKKGCMIGIGSIILPGVTIGEGSIVGAGSLVSKDIPAWTVAVGSPAKVIRKIPERP
jgi:acetyltransferase-like isoleucine patch superfamily enzyme